MSPPLHEIQLTKSNLQIRSQKKSNQQSSLAKLLTYTLNFVTLVKLISKCSSHGIRCIVVLNPRLLAHQISAQYIFYHVNYMYETQFI